MAPAVRPVTGQVAGRPITWENVSSTNGRCPYSERAAIRLSAGFASDSTGTGTPTAVLGYRPGAGERHRR